MASGGGEGEADRTSGGGGVGGGIGDSTAVRNTGSHCGGHEKGWLASTLSGVMVGAGRMDAAAPALLRSTRNMPSLRAQRIPCRARKMDI